MQKYRDVVQDRFGNAQVGASVQVNLNGAAATIYSDDELTAATNPLTTDSNGEFEFYAVAGDYSLVISGANITTDTIYVSIPSDSDFISVKDYGAIGDDSANETTAFSSARDFSVTNSAQVYVPRGTYRLNESFDWQEAMFVLDKGAEIVDLNGAKYDGYADGSYIGDYVSPKDAAAEARIQTPLIYFHHAMPTLTAGSPYDHTYQIVREYDGTADNAYLSAGGNLWLYQKYGAVKQSLASYASGTSNALGAIVDIHAANNGSSNRTEICPIASAANCVSTAAVQAGINIYNDFVVSGPKSASASDREGFLAGLCVLAQKYTTSNTLDSTHSGSFGVTVATRAGTSPGFSPEDKSSHQTYPLLAGYAVSGWSGPSTATDGSHADATNGYEYGIIIGGPHSVWVPWNSRSRIGTGIEIRDHVSSGLRITTNYSGAKAIAVTSTGGISTLGTETAIGGAWLTIGAMSGQFEQGFSLSANSHVTSERVGINWDGWIVGQDSAGDGTKDFFWYSNALSTTPLLIQANGNVQHLKGLSPLSGTTGMEVGFNHVSAAAGVPSGTPSQTPSGTVPMYFDTTNNKFYVYDGGWLSVTLS